MNFRKKKRSRKAGSAGDTAREFLRNQLSRFKGGLAPAPGGSSLPGMQAPETGAYDDRGFMQKIEQMAAEAGVFSVLMVKADAVATAADTPVPENREPETDHVAGIIGALCGRETGIWGRLEGGEFACCLPGVDVGACLAISEKIISGVRALNNGSVSIGAAGYPLLEYQREQIVANARKALNHAAFFGPGSVVAFDAVSLNISGDAMYQEGDIRGAAEEFEQGLRIDPGDENLHNSLGVCYGEQGDFAGALKAFENAVAINPKNVMALHNAGYTKAMMDDIDGALDYFMRADALGDDVFEVVFHAGKLLAETGNHDRANPYLARAVKLNPDAGAAHYILGECCRQMGLREAAVNAYKSAIRCNPNDAAALSSLGSLYDEMGENPEIPLIFCEKSVELSPDNGLFAFRLGRVLQNQNETQRALAMFEKALDLGYDAEDQVVAVREALSKER